MPDPRGSPSPDAGSGAVQETRLGRVGVWIGGYGPPASVDLDVVGEIEALGYGAFWFGEAPGGREPFVRATTLLAGTERIVIATGVASIWARDATSMSAAGRTIGEAFPGRFVLGMGVSHPPAVAMRGSTYQRPLAFMRSYLEQMASLDQPSPAPARPVPTVIAALRPRMLELASQATDGAHPYFVPVEHTARAREILGPARLLAPELAVVLESDPVEARRLARAHTSSFYLGAPNYVENLRWLGFTDDDMADGGSDALVDAIVAWGDDDAIRRRVREHLDAGADHVCIQPVTDTVTDAGSITPIELLRRLAPALGDA
ncbi:MAG TPA: TIGR03620 family F420-dependent LLM class oxidoreductase [Ilumatobacteraceae bacterium]|nr:TIGR03620 family F420-dependent LLM class oxidoreductase [Ilumatobacteraceae bacterium]